ncbi:MAG: sulfotransferase [Myxococcota bacterium]
MERFIVGTGRCGSTLLSRMMAESPEVTSIFEFFNGLDMTRRFTDEEMSGPEFATLISQPHPFIRMVLSRGYEVPEIVYPFGPETRYQRGDDIPWLLNCALPRLSDAPDALFDEAMAFAQSLPRRPLRDQYRAFFDWLVQHTGRRVWIERSGSAIDYMDSLNRLFPGARFLHIHRDGPEAALSMREHHAFRLAISLTLTHLRGEKPSLQQLGRLESSPDDEDEISRILAARPEVEAFGRFWTQQILRGFQALRRLDAEQYAEVRFEDLLERPERELRRIGRFFELDAEADGWLARAAGLIGGAPSRRAAKLSPEERARLEDACRPGMSLLGRA